MNNPLVSIIIPVYNAERFLPQCLDSVLNQTYSKTEVILVNDGSPDGSDAICQHYAHQYPQIRYFFRKNVGVSATRNFALTYATGDYIFFLDSDDYLEKDCIANMVDVAKTGKLVVTGFKIDDVAQDRVTIPQQYSGDYDNIFLYLNDFHHYFATKFNFAWGKLYKRSIIHEHHLCFDEGISLGEDLLFNIQYYEYCQNGIILLEDKGYYYRQSDSSTLSKKFDHRMFVWREEGYDALRDFLQNHNVMTPENRTHLYNSALGNLLYSTGLMSLQRNVSLSEKIKQIRTYASTCLARETYKFSHPTTMRGRIMKWLLKHQLAYTYIFSNQLIQKIKEIFK